jgi:hypothetical protein
MTDKNLLPKKETKPAEGIKTPAATDASIHAQLKKSIADLSQKVDAQAKEIDAFKALLPPNYQAIVVDKGGKLLIVYENADTNHNGFTSQSEALTAAHKFIKDNGLSGHYKAGVLPVW